MYEYPIIIKAEELTDEILDIAWKAIENKGEALLKTIQNRIIMRMQKVGEGFLSSGEDSGLKNYWDEYCVQVQDDHGWNFEMYEDLIIDQCNDSLKELENKNKPDYSILILYISICYFEESFDGDFSIYPIPELALKIFNNIRSIASDYTNSSIRVYLEK